MRSSSTSRKGCCSTVGWVVYDREQYAKNKWFAEELLKHCSSFAKMKLVIVEELVFGTKDHRICLGDPKAPLKTPDFVICRSILPLLTYTLEANGIRVFNNYTISSLCNNKCLTYAMAARCGIPVMDTLFCSSAFENPSAITNMGFPCILKSVDGHGGKEVFWIDSMSDYRQAISALGPKDHLLQRVCRTVGKDLRVYVLGGEILAGVLRSSDRFRSNYSLGGSASLYSLSESEKDLVNKVIRSLPSPPDLIGIDFLYDDGRLIFNEIEDVVGTRMLYDVSDIDAAKAFTEYIKKTMTE